MKKITITTVITITLLTTTLMAQAKSDFDLNSLVSSISSQAKDGKISFNQKDLEAGMKGEMTYDVFSQTAKSYAYAKIDEISKPGGKLQDVFNIIDTDHNGAVSPAELAAAEAKFKANDPAMMKEAENLLK